ncbi:MAG: ABC transporter substrate-binding protein [Candidatus Glassbacteria bacterium]
MRISFLLVTIGVTTLVVLTTCHKKPVTKPAMILQPECMIQPGEVEATDSITVALVDEVVPEHAPWPRNASEQLLFRHLYETLLTINCLGEVRAGLAETWSSGDGGRRWSFELREGARFWDQTPVTAGDVAGSWQRASVETMAFTAGIDSTAVTGDRILHLYFNSPYRKVPRMLADPEFAVVRWYADTRWPVGTGPYRKEPGEGDLAGGTELVITVEPVAETKGPVIMFLGSSNSDTRDLLDRVVDVAITNDPAVIEYAYNRPKLSAVALPWDRTYVLLSTSRVRKLQRGGTVGTLPQKLLKGLARDAVRAEARGYMPPSWWDDLHACGELYTETGRDSLYKPGASNTRGLRRIIYDTKDPVARDLAERIVALAAADPTASLEAAALALAVPGLASDTPRTIAEGVTDRELALSLRDGDDFAYVVAIPRRPADPCYEARKLINRAQWLASWEGDLTTVLVPLVDTRRYVIVTDENIGLMFDWNVSILITNGLFWER